MIDFNYYSSILQEELQVAMGCTEPIALAYVAAYAKSLLGQMPERCVAHCSGNIIKNVKAVVVPQTGGLRSIEAAILAGLHGGDHTKKLEVLTTLTDENRADIARDLQRDIVEVQILESKHVLHIVIELFAKGEHVSVELVDSHTHIGRVTKNGEILQEKSAPSTKKTIDRGSMSLFDILDYSKNVDLARISPLLEKQIEHNSAISTEGLTGDWGARVGKTLMRYGRDDIYTRMKAVAAAGSDARMNGCALPVVINSGSGNQGMCVSLPVICYADHIGATHEQLLRALAAANLAAIHQKTGIGKLSAFCGVVNAAAGALVGVAYLDGAGYDVIAALLVNTLGNIGGMVCDGAKSSCAGKIASAIESAILGYEMAKDELGFVCGEGIIGVNIEQTIVNVGHMASRGMKSTDLEILRIMLEQTDADSVC